MRDEHDTQLAPDLVAAIDQAVEAGDYASSDEVIGQAVRDWKERRENHGYTIAELKVLIQEGIDSGEPVEFDLEQFLSEMHARHVPRRSA